jgi:hypothetical protein
MVPHPGYTCPHHHSQNLSGRARLPSKGDAAQAVKVCVLVSGSTAPALGGAMQLRLAFTAERVITAAAKCYLRYSHRQNGDSMQCVPETARNDGLR